MTERDSTATRTGTGRRREYFGHQHVTVIRPPRLWPLLDLRETWMYRDLARVLAARDIKIRYKQTVLGALWAVLQPIITMVVFSLVFGGLAKIPSEGYPYPIFVYAALLPWTFFANAVTTSGTSLLSATQMVTKVYFPRLLIPISSIGSGLLDFAIATVVLLFLMVYYQVSWTLQLLAAPLLLVGVVMTIVGVGSWLAAVTVTYRDFRFVTPFLIQTWMFVTPVIYPTDLVPGRWQWLLLLNPMTGYIDGFRSAFLGKPFDWSSLGFSFAVSSVVLVAGLVYFGRAERRFADVI